jgi:predicted Zn-dependent peptidase
VNVLIPLLLMAQTTEAPATPPAADVPEVPASEAWRKEMPKSGQPRTPVFPKFETAKLENGLTVMVATVDTLPLVSFTLVTQGGSALDPKSKDGLTALTYAMLEEGAGELDALAFSDRVADLGAYFNATSDRDRGDVSIGGLSENADAMLGLLSDAVRRPKLAAKDFDRLKRQTVASLLQQRSSPQGLAFEVFPALIYGEDHPFGHPPSGTPQTVASIELADVKAQHERVIGPNTSALIASGAITLEEAVALAKKRFGDWTHRVPDVKPVPEVQPEKRAKVVVIDKPNTPQTIAIVGRPLFGRGHPDEVPLRLINEVYGGSFSSRLNMNLREEKGYTYGASSQVAFRRGIGVFLAYAAVRTDVTGPALEEFFSELEGLRTERAAGEELERARSGIIRSLPGQFETTGAIAGAAASLFVYDLPLDYYETLSAKYAQVGAEAAQKAGDQYLGAAEMKVLLVGDARQIVEPVKLLRLGEVELRTVE